MAGDYGGAGGYQKNYDATKSEDDAGAGTCGDGIDNGGEGVKDTNDRDCINPQWILVAPPGWGDDLAFADAGGILHTQDLRDCARGRLFSSISDELRIVLHETGHRPFGLRDEYCCDGGYGQSSIPTLYKTLNACETDAPNVGLLASDCRQLEKNDSTVNCWTSDPSSDHLMQRGGAPQPLAIRRIEWWFERCELRFC